MGFSSVDAVATAYENGSFWHSTYFKGSAPFIGNNVWTDMSTSIGLPVYQAYIGAPLKGIPVTGGDNEYIFTGPTPPSGQTKYLLNWSIAGQASGATQVTFILYDLLLFYSYLDGTDITPQILDNTLGYSRYSPTGVFPIFITQTPGTAGAVACDITYTNQDGVAGRSLKMAVGGGSTIGRIMNLSASVATASTPFIQLANGDNGVAAIESVQFNASVGGFVTVALVKPIAQITQVEQGTFMEKNYLRTEAILPEIKNGAALQMMFLQASGAGSLGTVTSFFETVWG